MALASLESCNSSAYSLEGTDQGILLSRIYSTICPESQIIITFERGWKLRRSGQ